MLVRLRLLFNRAFRFNPERATREVFACAAGVSTARFARIKLGRALLDEPLEGEFHGAPVPLGGGLLGPLRLVSGGGSSGVGDSYLRANDSTC